MQAAGTQRRKNAVFIVEPRLWSIEGHEIDHVLEFARAAKEADRHNVVTVLTGPQDRALAEALSTELCIDRSHPAFPARMIGDGSFVHHLLSASFCDALRLRRRLPSRRDGRTVLFFPTLGLYHILMLAFLRASAPWRKIRAVGILRNDPLTPDGALRRKYRWITRVPPLSLLWRIGLTGTAVYTDSELLQTAAREHLSISAGIAPIPVGGVWRLEDAGELGMGNSGVRPVTVGFIGQPRASRAFPLFASTALAMAREREEGEVIFRAVIPPGGDIFWGADVHTRAFRDGSPGMAIEERVMDALAFAQEMNRVDIVWAVGEPEIYSRQTSGIFTHAMCLGKKVMTNRGGWAEHVAGGSTAVAFIDPTIEESLMAIRQLVCKSPSGTGGEEAGRWRDQHSRKAFHEFVRGALA